MNTGRGTPTIAFIHGCRIPGRSQPNLTVNYALGYELETGLFYWNLPLPQYLAPILEGQTGGAPYGLGATQPDYLDFSPMVGFAWAVGKDQKTVIRGGGGMYWDTQPIWQHFREGAAIGPLGDGRTTLASTHLPTRFLGSSIFRPLPRLPMGASIPVGRHQPDARGVPEYREPATARARSRSWRRRRLRAARTR